MATLNTVFKKVFGEGLKEYGFVKVKGRQPYLVRVIGGEIIHVITCRNEWCGERGCKAFMVFATIDTVYDIAMIDLTRSPHYNIGWLESMPGLYYKSNPVGCDSGYQRKISSFMYKADDEESLHHAMEEALLETKNIILPIFDEVTNLEACINYVRRYQFSIGKLVSLYIKTDNHDDLINICKAEIEEVIKAIESGHSSWSVEKVCELKEKSRMRTVINRDKIYDNPELYARELEELERCREVKQVALRSCGLGL